MANNLYLTQVKSGQDAYNIKDTEAITGIVLKTNSGSNALKIEDGIVTIDLSTKNTTTVTASDLNNLLGEDSNLSISNGKLFADVPLKSIKIPRSYNNFDTIAIDSSKVATLPLATSYSCGVIKLGSRFQLSTDYSLMISFGDSNFQFPNITLETENLDFSNFENTSTKKITLKNNAASLISKEYLFNQLKNFSSTYLNNTYSTKDNYDNLLTTLYGEDGDKTKSIEELLISSNKITKKIITSLSSLPNLSNLTDEEKNTFYIYKSQDEDILAGNYVYTAKQIDSAYKWVCISTPQKNYETEDIDFPTMFTKYDNYNTIQNSSSFSSISELKTYLNNNGTLKTTRLVNGEKKETAIVKLIANGGDLDYVNFDVLVASNGYYFYTPSYSEENNVADISVLTSDTAVNYNGTNIVTYLFKAGN